MENNNSIEQQENIETVRKIIETLDGSENLVAILLEIHGRLGYLPREAMLETARLLGMSETTVYSVATFYNRFRFVPPGRHGIRACMGTACHVKRGDVILDIWKRRLEISEGGVTEDREYSLDRVDCVGCCAMAPVTVVDDNVHGKMTPASVDGILLGHRIDREQKEKSERAAAPEDTPGEQDV